MKSSAEIASGEVGEIVWAGVRNPFENRRSQGKMRPVVLVERDGGHFRTMGLTTNETYRDGSPRTPIPDPAAVGLRGRGYLWGDRLTNVSAIDIGDHIGWVDAALAEAIVSQAQDLGADAARRLLAAARGGGPPWTTAS